MNLPFSKSRCWHCLAAPPLRRPRWLPFCLSVLAVASFTALGVPNLHVVYEQQLSSTALQ
jgi:hypothetical protein